MINKENKVEVRKKTLAKLEELYDRRNVLRAKLINVELELNNCLTIINYIDNKVDVDELGDEKI